MTRKKLFVPTLCLGWLVVGAASAQMNDLPQPTSYFNHRAAGSIASSDEVTFSGTIQQIVAKPAPGAPVGTHILLTTSDGVVDASLGPYLTKNVQQSLTNGQQVQVVGVLRASGDQNYLLARQLVVNGESINVRNEYGFLVRTQAHARSQSRPDQSAANGGVQ